MLSPQSNGIIPLERKIPNRLGLPPVPHLIKLRATRPDMLKQTRRHRPPNLIILIRVLLQQRIRVPLLSSLVPMYHVCDAAPRERKRLRTAPVPRHFMHAWGDRKHGSAAGGEEEDYTEGCENEAEDGD